MAACERYEIELANGTVLHQLSNEDRLYGYVVIEADGRARVWVATWPEFFKPTHTVFPGFISAARACIMGWV